MLWHICNTNLNFNKCVHLEMQYKFDKTEKYSHAVPIAHERQSKYPKRYS